MKALLQRVTRAAVRIDGSTVGEVGPGLVIFVGVEQGDAREDATYLKDKIVNLRIFADQADRFNLSALDTRAELLVVSQFTLLADTRKGRRPSFVKAAPPEVAEPMVEQFVALLRETGLK
ncbi:MAG: D-aminoacyl-tRNA deacylase, partial [Dehalococcoidia bacterium]